MNELPIVVSGFLVGSIFVGVTTWVLLGSPVYRSLIGLIASSAALAGLSISNAVVLASSPGWALSAGFWTAGCIALAIFLFRLPDFQGRPDPATLAATEEPDPDEGPDEGEDGHDFQDPVRGFRRSLAIVTVLAAGGGFHLAYLLEETGDGGGFLAAPWAAVRATFSGFIELASSFGRPTSSRLLLAAILVALLIEYLRRRSQRTYDTIEWPVVVASGLTGALVAWVLAGQDFPVALDSGPRLLGAAAAVLLLGLFLASVVRGDRPGFDSYTGGLGDGLGGWRVTPSLAYLLGALALMAVFLTGTKSDTGTGSEPQEPVVEQTPTDGEGESEAGSAGDAVAEGVAAEPVVELELGDPVDE